LLDRMDLHLTVRPVTSRDVLGPAGGESTAAVRERVLLARRVREDRFQSGEKPDPMPVAALREAPGSFRSVVGWAMDGLGMSARGIARAFRVARTIADLAGADNIEPLHFEEAIQFRATAERTNPQAAGLTGRKAATNTVGGAR
jgi:magnesium chelatase family protein